MRVGLSMVKVECDGCKAPYQIDAKRIPPTGLKMRCPKCGTNLLVTKPAAQGQDGGPPRAPGDADLPAVAGRPGSPGAPPPRPPPRPPPPAPPARNAPTAPERPPAAAS